MATSASLLTYHQWLHVHVPRYRQYDHSVDLRGKAGHLCGPTGVPCGHVCVHSALPSVKSVWFNLCQRKGEADSDCYAHTVS